MAEAWADFPNLTDLIRRSQQGSKSAENEFFDFAYAHFRRIGSGVASRFSNVPMDGFEDLVHDVYLRLHGKGCEVRDRNHYLAKVHLAFMSHACDLARRAGAAKRDRNAAERAFPERLLPDLSLAEILDLRHFMDELRRLDKRAAAVVALKYDRGCSWEEIATLLRISPSKARKDWKWASDWLRENLKEH